MENTSSNGKFTKEEIFCIKALLNETIKAYIEMKNKIKREGKFEKYVEDNSTPEEMIETIDAFIEQCYSFQSNPDSFFEQDDKNQFIYLSFLNPNLRIGYHKKFHHGVIHKMEAEIKSKDSSYQTIYPQYANNN